MKVTQQSCVYRESHSYYKKKTNPQTPLLPLKFYFQSRKPATFIEREPTYSLHFPDSMCTLQKIDSEVIADMLLTIAKLYEPSHSLHSSDETHPASFRWEPSHCAYT